MTMKLRLGLRVTPLLLALAGCTTTTGGPDTLQVEPKTDQLIPVSSEKLLAAPPTGWQRVYELNNGKTRLTDFIPADESRAEWSTKLSFESHESLTEANPIEIVMGELENTSEICEPIQSFNLFSGNENNYPTSVRLTFCGKNAHSNKGEVTISKVIQGNEFLYIIKVINQMPTYENADDAIAKEKVAAWSQYFRDIVLCDESLPEHPCPISTDE
jgi:hypothetical protein